MISRTTIHRASLAIGLALGLLLLILAFRVVDPSSLVAALAGTQFHLVALALLTVAATVVAKALRWRLLYYPAHRNLRLTSLLSAILIGQTMNFLLPIRVGELARAYLVGEAERLSKLLALGTIMVEKLLDGLMLLLIVGLLFLLMPVPDWLRIAGVTMGLTLGGLLATILLLTGQRERILGAVGRLGELTPFLERLDLRQRLAALADGLSSLRDGTVNVRLLAWSLCISFLAASTNYLTLVALRIEVPLLTASLFVLAVLHLGLAVPSSPARIGVFQFLCLLSLSFLGVEGPLALAYGFVLYAIVVLPVILAGILCLWKGNLTLYRLASQVEDN